MTGKKKTGWDKKRLTNVPQASLHLWQRWSQLWKCFRRATKPQRDFNRSQRGLHLAKMLLLNEIFGIIKTKVCKWRRQKESNKEQDSSNALKARLGSCKYVHNILNKVWRPKLTLTSFWSCWFAWRSDGSVRTVGKLLKLSGSLFFFFFSFF